MKINSYAPIPSSFGRISEASNDKQGGAGSNAFERQGKKDNKDDHTYEATAEEVEAAIETFSGDETNLSRGISATAEGQGPGLKVVLKDATGGILRSVSGEEFLRLREALHSGQKSGRLLDQKA